MPHGLDVGLARLLCVNDKQRPILGGRERFRLTAEGERRLAVQFNSIRSNRLLAHAQSGRKERT